MIFKNLKELDESKKIVLEMREQSTNDYVILVLTEMLNCLAVGDVENSYNPSSISIIRFGYDIFGSPLHR